MQQGGAAKVSASALITLERFRLLERALVARGYQDSIDWSEAISEPVNGDEFAERSIYVICNSGMANTVAQIIFERVMSAVRSGVAATDVYRHPGKSQAIDQIWARREDLFHDYRQSTDKLETLRLLPFVGEITALHLAKNLGSDVAKPDVHLERLARREGSSTADLCARLSHESGYRAATVDTILWKACAERILNSREYELSGWEAAFQGR